jgi:hypothetical protein
MRANKAVGKLGQRSRISIPGDRFMSSHLAIVDLGPFCEVDFMVVRRRFAPSEQFYSLNV